MNPPKRKKKKLWEIDREIDLVEERDRTILHQNSIVLCQHVAYFQSQKSIKATLCQFVDEELIKGERERIGAEEIEKNWFCDLWGREEDEVKEREIYIYIYIYMKSSLIIWAPQTWCFYKNATVFIFIENENGQKLYSFSIFKFIFV